MIEAIGCKNIGIFEAASRSLSEIADILNSGIRLATAFNKERTLHAFLIISNI